MIIRRFDKKNDADAHYMKNDKDTVGYTVKEMIEKYNISSTPDVNYIVKFDMSRIIALGIILLQESLLLNTYARIALHI